MTTDDTTAAFFTRHPPDAHPHLFAACRAFEADTCKIDRGEVPVACSNLLATYRVRAHLLAQYASPHAAALLADVNAFCENLTANRDKTCRWWSFQLTDGTLYLFAEQTETSELLGALRVVSKLAVPSEEWERLWGGAV